MLQASLKPFLLLLLLRLCKKCFGHHAQVGYRIEVGSLYVKHCCGIPLTEDVGDYMRPRLCRYYYLSQIPPQISHSVSGKSISLPPLGKSVNTCAAVGCPPLLSRSCPSNLYLYSPNISLRFLGYCTRG